MKAFEHQLLLMVIFGVPHGHFPTSQRDENTDNEHGLICLWHDQLMTIKRLETSEPRIWGTISVITFHF